ncbi:NADH-quinone oxidoreductase subunit L [Granulicella mallensis]|uniref:NADH-quinone oxidoreductase subunit L n=1 Tax=Granulicella mallensis TaxID=940614 RepID=A0A7W7ZV06_9BACT|nr:NADH-quinone oxidoreductase subunit L [Granulicella mallensis]MBB5065756.1 NADH-quinone oxidoreductase subunit L [Granulicella mallensis]
MNPQLLWLIPILPFAGFLINGTVGRKLPRAAVSAIALLFTAAPAVIVAMLWNYMKFGNGPLTFSAVSRPWIAVSGFQVNFAFTVDHLTLIMLAVITGVGFLIHLYSVGYMAHEDGFWRFFAYLNLFMFFMLVLVLSSSFLLLFVGWEGVGLASYLLIGFYFTKDSAANAGKKAFVVNRIGDFGFLLAMFLLLAHFGSLDFNSVFTQISATPLTGGFLTAIALLLVVGATGKSAQIPLYIWLPDAMEGPTPVSALIHAATMVTAGIYMVARCHVLFDKSPTALMVVAVIGAATALMAATIGMVQHDIKRVLAYSTVSQLGYMFLACGVGAYSAAIFHLMTHAFFKALLFLAAGSVIHALSGEQDMRVMGGLWRKIPVTFGTMTMGVLAIAGIPIWAGFFSKDEILYQAFISDNPLAKLLWLVGLITAGLTSFYMFRLWFKTFFGAPRFEEHGHSHDLHAAHGAAIHARHDTKLVLEAEPEPAHGHAHGVHESPWIMTLPLIILAILATVGGWVGVPLAFGGHNEFEHFLEPVFSSAAVTPEHVSFRGAEPILAVVSIAVAVLGFLIAYFCYYRKPGTAGAFAQKFKPLYSLLDHKYWVDEIYGTVIVTPLLAFSRFFLGYFVDTGLVQGTGGSLTAGTRSFAWLVRRVQSGNIRSYAGWLALGAAAVIAVVVFGLHPHLR